MKLVEEGALVLTKRMTEETSQRDDWIYHTTPLEVGALFGVEML